MMMEPKPSGNEDSRDAATLMDMAMMGMTAASGNVLFGRQSSRAGMLPYGV